VAGNIRSLSEVFAELRSARRIGVLPFIPAGYPDLGSMQAILPALEAGGASAVEVGIPFSDPIADGPTIQEAFNLALANKVRVKDVFSTVAAVRGRISLPLIAMVSFSIVYRYGLERFVGDARAAGFGGLILPDVPPPEAAGICAQVRSGGLDTILLVSPTTAPERQKEIAGLCSGFVYYLSVSGITGARDELPADLTENVRRLRGMTQVPVCVGFGISQARHVAQLAGVADGAIVGSAFVKKIGQYKQAGSAAMAAAAGEYCRELVRGNDE
jgi:tryptophan synthase alpha chain